MGVYVYPSSNHDAEVAKAIYELDGAPFLDNESTTPYVVVNDTDLRLLLKDHARLKLELERVQRAPELEWEKVKAKILAVLARIAREGGRDYALEMQSALDAGSVYVAARLRAADEELERVKRWAKGRCETCAHAKLYSFEEPCKSCSKGHNGDKWKPGWNGEAAK